MQIEEVTEIKNDEATKVEEVNDDEAPDLEEVTIEELEKSKEEQRAKFLAKVMTETEQSKEIQKNEVPEKTEEVVADKDSQKDEIEQLEDILRDEKKCQEIQNKITKKDIETFIDDQAEAATAKEGTDFDELD